MNYYVTINKKFQYVKVFGIVKKINEKTNPLSKALSSFIEGMITKKGNTGQV